MPAGWLDNLSTRALRNTAVLLGAVLALAVVALVLSIENRVHAVPQEARNAAKLVAREQADHRATTLLHRVVLRSCRNQNKLRRVANNSQYGDYVLFSFVLRRSAPKRAETPQQRKVERQFDKKLRRVVRDTTWTPLTNCKRAVGARGARYLSPSPVRFSKRLPPASALPPVHQH